MRGVVVGLLLLGGCKLPTATTSLPQTKEERRAYVKKWAPIHQRAVRARAAQILECAPEQLSLKLTSAGPLHTEDAMNDRFLTKWDVEGCDKEGAWVTYCPPMPRLGNAEPGPGQVACEVRRDGRLEAIGANRVLSDQGVIVVVDVEDKPVVAQEEFPDD
jgi:hypothetical protein